MLLANQHLREIIYVFLQIFTDVLGGNINNRTMFTILVEPINKSKGLLVYSMEKDQLKTKLKNKIKANQRGEK